MATHGERGHGAERDRRRRPRFRLFETTADAGFFAWGDDTADLFANAAAGLSRLVGGPFRPRPRFVRRVTAAGADREALLVAWLSEWLFLFDTEGFLAGEFTLRRLSRRRVEGIGRGEPCGSGSLRLAAGVKGITYHGLSIVRTAGGRLRARIICDI